MVRTKVFSDWERWNFIEILLEYMVDDLKTRYKSNNSERIVAQLRILDLEHNILQAKGLRTALCVRIVHTKLQSDAVIYVLRVEDVETGLQWVVHRRYRDFAALNEELSDMSHFTRDIPFPRKRFTNSNNPRVVEERIIALEQYARRVLHVLTLYATMDPLASRSLRHFQNFVGVDRYIDCIHPPVVDDQRCIELLAYRILNDFSSPACQQCIRFVGAVDLESLVEDGPNGYKPMLKHLSLALAEVEAFVLENHMAEMLRKLAERKPQYTAEQSRVFVRRCVRRQVEASIFLPLRRTVFRIVYSFVAVQAQCMHRAMGLLQQAAPDYFEVDPYILQTGAMPRAIKAFRDVIQAYLPADQGQLLMHAAAAVMQLHSECSAHGGSKKKKKSVPDQDSEAESIMSSSEGSGSSRGKKKSISIQDAIRERESIHSNGDGGDMYDSSHREAAYAIPTATNMKIKAMSTNINSSGSRSGSASSLGISGPKGGRIKVAGTTSTTSSVTTPTNGGTANGDIDFTSKATIADPVGTIFHSFETSHTNAPISRKSSVNGHDTDDSRHKTNSVDHNTNGSKAMGNNHNRIVSTGAIDSSQAASRVIAKHDSRSKDDDHNDRNDEGSGLTFSPSAAAFLPSPVRSNSDLELMANEEKESIGCADSESSVDSRPHGKSSENYFTAEDCRTYGGDLDSPDKGSESGQDEDAETCEESTLKKRVLNDKLKSLSLVPETPNPSASFGDLDSTDKEDIAGDGLGRESVSLKTLRESVEDKRRILFPPEDSMQPPLRAPNAKTEFRKLESNSSENNEGIDTASADAYFTAEENMVIEEAWQGREYVSETVNTNNSATLSLAAAADLFRATLTGGGGNNTERFGDDSKMTATTTTQFFDVSVPMFLVL